MSNGWQCVSIGSDANALQVLPGDVYTWADESAPNLIDADVLVIEIPNADQVHQGYLDELRLLRDARRSILWLLTEQSDAETVKKLLGLDVVRLRTPTANWIAQRQKQHKQLASLFTTSRWALPQPQKHWRALATDHQGTVAFAVTSSDGREALVPWEGGTISDNLVRDLVASDVADTRVHSGTWPLTRAEIGALLLILTFVIFATGIRYGQRAEIAALPDRNHYADMFYSPYYHSARPRRNTSPEVQLDEAVHKGRWGQARYLAQSFINEAESLDSGYLLGMQVRLGHARHLIEAVENNFLYGDIAGSIGSDVLDSSPGYIVGTLTHNWKLRRYWGSWQPPVEMDPELADDIEYLGIAALHRWEAARWWQFAEDHPASEKRDEAYFNSLRALLRGTDQSAFHARSRDFLQDFPNSYLADDVAFLMLRNAIEPADDYTVCMVLPLLAERYAQTDYGRIFASEMSSRLSDEYVSLRRNHTLPVAAALAKLCTTGGVELNRVFTGADTELERLRDIFEDLMRNWIDDSLTGTEYAGRVTRLLMRGWALR